MFNAQHARKISSLLDASEQLFVDRNQKVIFQGLEVLPLSRFIGRVLQQLHIIVRGMLVLRKI
jgi:hypothetical protein